MGISTADRMVNARRNAAVITAGSLSSLQLRGTTLPFVIRRRPRLVRR
jgi:hypothetical protein